MKWPFDTLRYSGLAGLGQAMKIRDRHVSGSGLLVVFSGPSGAGKDTVLEELAKVYPNFRRCVTTTTRERRDYEIDGQDYTFISVREFRARIDRGEFLEWAEVHGNLYGTPRQWVEDRLGEGTDIILKIDVQGGANVKRQMPSALLVFVTPPSLEELELRLRGRGSESEEDISERLANAKQELDQIPGYDYVVENDSVARAADELRAILVAEHCKVR
jgi:guanylate kinase